LNPVNQGWALISFIPPLAPKRAVGDLRINLLTKSAAYTLQL